MRKVFTYKNYIVFKQHGGGYVLYNILKPFKEGHTHLNSCHIAKKLIYLEINKEIPRDITQYLLVSLRRITSDSKYKQKINEELDRRGEKR